MKHLKGFKGFLVGLLILLYMGYLGAWWNGYRIIRPNDKEDDRVEFNGQQAIYHK